MKSCLLFKRSCSFFHLYKITCLILISAQSYSQKLSIDPLNFKVEEELGQYQISDNGRYILYAVGSIVYIHDVQTNKIIRSIANSSSEKFTADSKFLVYFKEDSLHIWNIGNDKTQSIPDCRYFEIIHDEKTEMVVVQQPQKVSVLNLKNLREYHLPAGKVRTNKEGTVLLITQPHKLFRVDLRSFKLQVIYEGSPPTKYSFNKTGKQLAFFVKENNQVHLFFWTEKMPYAIPKTPDVSNTQTDSFKLADTELQFSDDNEYLVCNIIRSKKVDAPIEGLSSVNIWNYKDPYFQPAQLKGKGAPKKKLQAIINIHHPIVNIIEQDGEVPVYNALIGNYFLFQTAETNDSYYNSKNWPSVYLVNVKTGERETVANKEASKYSELRLSPKGRFVIWFSHKDLQYHSYEISTKVTRVITKNEPIDIYDEVEYKKARIGCFGIAGWIEEENSVVVYDEFDLWEIDLQGKRPAINLTHNYGKNNGVILGVVSPNYNDNFHTDQTLLLSAFNPENKECGFSLLMLKERSVTKAKMEACNMYIARGVSSKGPIPLKAKNINRYLIIKMTASQAPNLFITDDFKVYSVVSNIQLYSKYNWLTAQLIKYPMLNGGTGTAILYRPQNFDSTKRYPIIFNFYEHRSDELHEFLRPDLTAHNINIPVFVSNNYLVCVPDVSSWPGHRGEGTYNCIVGAAQYMSTFRWVDSTRMAIQGHSYGGFQTNYLVTHSTLFAAACEMAGTSNSVSSFNYINFDGNYRGQHFETYSQGAAQGLGVTPWVNPNAYINESAVFAADKAKTPLLMAHCRKDNQVPFEQAIELYTSLKRAQKAVWFLEYDNSDHQLINYEDQKDFTIRLFQFFDHYLKHKPAPSWMTRGVPAYLKGTTTGYDPDPQGWCSDSCVICKYKQYE